MRSSPFGVYVRDHPRVGGEKPLFTCLAIGTSGSPPRGRGKGWTMPSAYAFMGITPAWAGKSEVSKYAAKPGEDHPRVGGEKLRVALWRLDTLGSPPRGRGKAARLRAWPSALHTGSPPRGRGKGIFSPPFDNPKRITPAWAGKSQQWPHMCGRSWDHPRVGGEKFLGLFLGHPRGGSPPRGRGKGLSWLLHLLRRRITPAWAGKRLKRSHRSGIFISGPIPFHSVLHRPAGSGGSRAGRDGSPAGQPQNAGPA